MVQLKELRTNDRNPRIIKSEQFEKLVKSIKKYTKEDLPTKYLKKRVQRKGESK